MASEGASGADRSDNDKASDQSSKAERAGRDLSETSRETLSGGSRAAPQEATAADRAASQSRMEATGKAAKSASGDLAVMEAPPAAQGTPSVSVAPAVATAASVPGVTLAQHAPGVPAAPAIPGLPGPVALGRGLRALSPAGAAYAAAVGLGKLNDMAANARVQAAAEHLKVDLTTVEGISAANAYAAAAAMTETPIGAEAFRDITGLPIDPEKVVPGGPHRHAMLETIAQIEFDRPGTFFDPSVPAHRAWSNVGEVMGPQMAATLDAVDRGLTSGAPGALVGAGLAVERVSAVDPALSVLSGRARAALIAAGGPLPQRWEAHHKVPFATVAALPVDAQLAIANSGWRMDGISNLAALPADYASYSSAPNNFAYPMHSGSHPNYSAMVAAQLSPLAVSAPNLAPPALRSMMNTIGAASLELTRNTGGTPATAAFNHFHDRLN